MEQLLGFLLGILGSLIVWWVFAHWLVPVVAFEDKILVRPGKVDPAQPRYFVKIANRGRRDLIDATMIAVVSIQTRAGSEAHWASVRLAFHRTGETEHHFPLIPAGRNRLVTLHAGHSEQIVHEPNFSDAVRQGAGQHRLDLATLMEDGAGRGLRVRLRVYVLGYDRFSGARKLFHSKQYESADLQAPPPAASGTTEILTSP